MTESRHLDQPVILTYDWPRRFGPPYTTACMIYDKPWGDGKDADDPTAVRPIARFHGWWAVRRAQLWAHLHGYGRLSVMSNERV